MIQKTIPGQGDKRSCTMYRDGAYQYETARPTSSITYLWVFVSAREIALQTTYIHSCVTEHLPSPENILTETATFATLSSNWSKTCLMTIMAITSDRRMKGFPSWYSFPLSMHGCSSQKHWDQLKCLHYAWLPLTLPHIPSCASLFLAHCISHRPGQIILVLACCCGFDTPIPTSLYIFGNVFICFVFIRIHTQIQGEVGSHNALMSFAISVRVSTCGKWLSLIQMKNFFIADISKRPPDMNSQYTKTTGQLLVHTSKDSPWYLQSSGLIEYIERFNMTSTQTVRHTLRPQ